MRSLRVLLAGVVAPHPYSCSGFVDQWLGGHGVIEDDLQRHLPQRSFALVTVSELLG